MSIQKMYRECERLYTQIRRDDPETMKRYEEAVRKLEEMREEPEDNRHLAGYAMVHHISLDT